MAQLFWKPLGWDAYCLFSHHLSRSGNKQFYKIQNFFFNLWASLVIYCVVFTYSLKNFWFVYVGGIRSRPLFNRWFVTRSEVTRERGHIRALYYRKRTMHYVLGMYFCGKTAAPIASTSHDSDQYKLVLNLRWHSNTEILAIRFYRLEDEKCISDTRTSTFMHDSWNRVQNFTLFLYKWVFTCFSVIHPSFKLFCRYQWVIQILIQRIQGK